MADLDKLTVHGLDTPQAGCLERLDLQPDEQVECEHDLGHK